MQCLRIPSVDPSEGQIYPSNAHSVLTLGPLSLHRRRKTVLFLVGCNGHLALISAGLSRKVSLIGSLLALLSLSMTCHSALVVACHERWEGRCLFLLSGQHCPRRVRRTLLEWEEPQTCILHSTNPFCSLPDDFLAWVMAHCIADPGAGPRAWGDTC